MGLREFFCCYWWLICQNLKRVGWKESVAFIAVSIKNISKDGSHEQAAIKDSLYEGLGATSSMKEVWEPPR